MATQGSLVGATSFVMLLPESESAVLVVTNTMIPNDAADWIGQLLIETLLDGPIRDDYVHLASKSVDRALMNYEELGEQVEAGRKPGGPIRSLGDYVGSYIGFGGIFRIQVLEMEVGLEIRFQDANRRSTNCTTITAILLPGSCRGMIRFEEHDLSHSSRSCASLTSRPRKLKRFSL